MLLVSQPFNAVAAKTPPWSKGKSRCGTLHALGMYRASTPARAIQRRSLGIPFFPHRLPAFAGLLRSPADRAGLQPLPALAGCRVPLWLPLPLRSLRQPPASRSIRYGVSERARAASAWRRHGQEAPSRLRSLQFLVAGARSTCQSKATRRRIHPQGRCSGTIHQKITSPARTAASGRSRQELSSSLA